MPSPPQIKMASIVSRTVLLVLLFHGFTVAQDLQAYIKRKEDQVRQMAAEIVRLDNSRCDLAASCSSGCSRHACTPIDGIKDPNKYNFTCQSRTEPIPECGNCSSVQVNYAMSYVRMPLGGTISDISDAMCSTICMTKEFTSTQKNLSGEDIYHERFFFGSCDGVFRFFPGEETREDRCSIYDPRKRTWYKGATSVKKHIFILIDHSDDAYRYNVPWRKTSLSAIDASKQIAEDLIYTLSSEDVVNVIAFNENNALNVTPYQVTIPDDGNVSDDRLKDLVISIQKFSIPQQSFIPSSQGLLQGIYAALQPDNYCDDRCLKVIFLVTKGGIANGLQRTDVEKISEMHKNQSTQLCIYSFENSTNLESLANEAGGYFQIINDNFDNPLYQISSFFNFMALARNASNDKPYWSKYFGDYEGIGNIITVSYPAISSMGHLLGVTGITIMEESFQDKLPNVLGDDFGGISTNPNALINALNITETKNICELCDGSRAVCPKSSSKTFAELKCCDTCISHGRIKWNRGKTIASTVVPGVVVIVLIISVVWWRRIRREGSGSPKPILGNISSPDVGPYR